ncbi:Hypothetical predicted protein [Prunus dulcis]|uniref:Uncharacterized protein n=1 Tax=Prunus dulcis TaxID=3755 RepID=A0A5E4FIV1_PRUDU|nr:hypothetical protein L3X38_000355 [Prunus dulcis]VVA28033.1 Hypothetical predicted protein [Prunus dulcis]
MGFTRRLDPSLTTLHCVMKSLLIKNSVDLMDMGSRRRSILIALAFTLTEIHGIYSAIGSKLDDTTVCYEVVVDQELS